MMKRLTAFLVCGSMVLVSSAAAGGAVGSAFGTLTTARAQGMGKTNLGVGIGIADANSVFGTLTYGLSQYWDGRLRLGLVDPGGGADVQLTLGGDFKWQFWNVGMSSAYPLDLAVGGFFEFADYGPVSALQIGGQILVSRSIHLRQGGMLTPYGRFNTRVEMLKLDLPPGSTRDDTESNLEIGLNGGVEWQLAPTVTLYGEFQFDGNDGLFFGIDFNVM